MCVCVCGSVCVCVGVCVWVCVGVRSYIIPDSDCSVWRLFGELVYLNLCASGMLDSSQVAVVLATTSVNTTLGMVF